MRKKLSTIMIGVVAAGAALLGVHPAEAAPAAARVPVLTEQVVIYQDAFYKNEITRFNLTSGTCNTSGYRINVPLLDAVRISSVLLWVPSQYSRCTYMQLENNVGVKYGTCVSHARWGIDHFGADFNDRTWTIRVWRNPSCPAW